MEALTEKYVGETAQLHCKIKVPLPTPTRKWTKVGGKMPASYRAMDDGKLIIEDVQESDAGLYSCLTSNDAGEITKEGRLTVYSKYYTTMSAQNDYPADSSPRLFMATTSSTNP